MKTETNLAVLTEPEDLNGHSVPERSTINQQPSTHSTPLKLFTDPSLLGRLHRNLLVRLLEDLRASLPPEAAALLVSGLSHEQFCAAWAAQFSSTGALGAPLVEALIAIETVALPENRPLLDGALSQLPPGYDVNRSLPPLNQALHLWLIAANTPGVIYPTASCSPSSTTLSATLPGRHTLGDGGSPTSSSCSSSCSSSSPPAADSSPDPLPPPLPPLPPVQKPGSNSQPSTSNPPASIASAKEDPLPAPHSDDPAAYIKSLLALPPVELWPDPVDGTALLDALAQTLKSFVVMPKWAAETLALWIVHTYAFQLRDITTYIGLESPQHRCGKSTLVTVLSELAHRAVVASNVSSPAFFRVIEQLRPALLIDEADTFLHGNEELRGILNSGYHRKTAYVLRAINQPNQASAGDGEAAAQNMGLARYSCWCPKVIARIGRLPATLADRCIVFRMQRKTPLEECARLRRLKAPDLQRQCARFVLDHTQAIASAQPEIPRDLNDRAADIWEPLLALADLAGGPWPDLARQAAVSVTTTSDETNPIAALLLDIYLLFINKAVDRMFSHVLVEGLNSLTGRPWTEMCRGKAITDLWLAQQLRPYGIRPRNLRLDGIQAKGYCQDDMMDVFRRYITKADVQALTQDCQGEAPQPEGSTPTPSPAVPEGNAPSSP